MSVGCGSGVAVEGAGVGGIAVGGGVVDAQLVRMSTLSTRKAISG